MKKIAIVMAAVLFLGAVAVFASTWYSSTVTLAGSGKANGPVFDLTAQTGTTHSTGPVRVKLSIQSSIAQLRGTCGPETGFVALTTLTVTARASHEYITRKPYASLYAHYSSTGKLSHAQYMDGVSQ